MNVKRIASVLIIGIMLLLQGVPVMAQASTDPVQEIINGDNEIGITPCWQNVNSVSLNISLSNGTVGCVGIINAVTGTTSIVAKFTLERQTLFGWSTVETWDDSISGTRLVFSGTAPGSTGNTYRLSVTAVVVRNGLSETVSTSAEGKL
jgi:uncharacterized membrane protein HdeD (DUF308 family)